MSEFRVRAARADELDAAGELTLDAYRTDGYLDHDPDASYAAELRDAASRAEHAELLVAVEESGAVLGSVTVVQAGSKYAELAAEGELEFRMLGVAPAARGRGVGEALVRAVLDQARELAVQRVVMCSMAEMATAHRLYQRLGFQRMPERDWVPVPEVRLVAFALELGA